MVSQLKIFCTVTFTSLSFFLFALVSSPASANETPVESSSQLIPITEQVASLVLGIIRYSRWPEQPQQVDICIVGDVHHAGLLLQSTHYIGDVPVVSQNVSMEQVLSLTTNCHLYYVGHLASKHYSQVYDAVGHSAVITIEEENELCSIGGMFCFFIQNERATFKVNLDAVSRSSVKIHPSVLRLGQHRSAL